jgi:hypothetical protein
MEDSAFVPEWKKLAWKERLIFLPQQTGVLVFVPEPTVELVVLLQPTEDLIFVTESTERMSMGKYIFLPQLIEVLVFVPAPTVELVLLSQLTEDFVFVTEPTERLLMGKLIFHPQRMSEEAPCFALELVDPNQGLAYISTPSMVLDIFLAIQFAEANAMIAVALSTVLGFR